MNAPHFATFPKTMIARALHQVQDAGLTALVLCAFRRPLREGLLSRLTPPPRVHPVAFAGRHHEILGDLYLPSDGRPHAGLILVHGLNESGKDDPRIGWLGRLLARVGFIVLAPDFPGFRSLRVRQADVGDLVDTFRSLASLTPRVRPERIGLMGFSYGAGPMLIAATDPAIRSQVRFVVSLGGYYDLGAVIRFITTGHFQHREHRGQIPPNPHARWLFLGYNLDLLRAEEDRRILGEIAAARATGGSENLSPRVDALTLWGRAFYDLLTNKDPARVEALIQRLDPLILAEIAGLSPSRVLGDLRADLVVIHGVQDDFIPYTESLRLAEAIPDKGRVRLAITRLLTHMDLTPPPTRWRLLTLYLPEAIRIAWVVRYAIAQRR